MLNSMYVFLQVVLMDAFNVFTCYASGRRHCQSMTVSLKLKPRQDLFFVLYNFVYPQVNKQQCFNPHSFIYILWH